MIDCETCVFYKKPNRCHENPMGVLLPKAERQFFDCDDYQAK
jgi:hypothetical protein